MSPAPVIRYDAATGSDTLASGAGPPVAVTGSSATNGAGRVVNLDGAPDLSGVLADGSHAIWAETASGAVHINSISAVDDTAKTITTANDTLVLGAGVNWAIGGVRQSLDADTSFQDTRSFRPGWSAELASGTYIASGAYAINGGSLGSGPITFRAATGETPTLSWIGNHALFQVNSGDFLHLEGITMTNIVSTSTAAQCLDIGSGGYVKAVNCTMRSARAVDCASGRLTMVGCDVRGVDSFGILFSGSSNATLTDTVVHDCGAGGVVDVGTGRTVIDGCRIHSNGSYGVQVTAAQANGLCVTNSSFYNNTDHGLYLYATAVIGAGPYTVENCVFASNGGRGQAWNGAGAGLLLFADFNAYYNNTSGEVSGLTKGEHSITLTADPFMDAAGGDFSLNDTAGGGAACKDVALGYGGSYTWSGVSDADALVKIKYDPVGGSDTLASGAGPATAITGTNAADTNSAAGATKIYLRNTPDLSGVSVDDVLWLNVSAGQQHLTRITAVDDGADTVDVEDAFTIGTGSPVSYAIGGKRKTLEADTTNTDVAQAKAGWVLELEDGADYAPAVELLISAGSLADGPVTIQAAPGAAPTVAATHTLDAIQVESSGHAHLVGLNVAKLTGGDANTRGVLVRTGGSAFAFGCVINSSVALYVQASRCVLVDCAVESRNFEGAIVTGAAHLSVIAGQVQDCASHGVSQTGTGAGSLVVCGSAIWDNAGAGILGTVSGANAFLHYYANNVIHGNTSHGVDLDGAMSTSQGPFVLLNNSITSNGAYGISADTAGASLLVHEDHGGYWSNTSGRTSNLDLGANSVIVSVDPYTDESTNDFSLNSAATGGAILSGAGFNGWDIGAAQLDGWDIGAFQGMLLELAEELLIFGARFEDDPPPPPPIAETETLLIFAQEVVVTADLIGLFGQPFDAVAIVSTVEPAESLVGIMAQPFRFLGDAEDIYLRARMEQRFAPKATLGGFDGRYPLTRPARGVAVCGGARRAAAQVNA